MRQASFSTRNSFLWNDLRHTIISVVDGDQVVLETGHNVFSTYAMRELEKAYDAGEILFSQDGVVQKKDNKHKDIQCVQRMLSDFSEATQRDSFRAHAYLSRLSEHGTIKIDRQGIIEEKIHEIAALIGDACPPHPTTVYRWQKKFEASGGDQHALIYRYEDRGGKGKLRCNAEEAAHQDKLIEELYLKRNGPNVEDVAQQMELDCKRANVWRIPSTKIKTRSTSSFRRRIKQYDPFDVVAAREGVDEARRRFKHNRKVPLTAGLLDLVEIDHTPFDLFVYDLENGIPLGRPTLTLAICRKSKMPWGFNIGFDDCSAEAVLACIAHGIKPKAYVKDQYPEIKGDWNVYGIPMELRCDNGLEFHSKALREVANEFCFELAFCPKRQPNWKGSSESFLKTINYQLIHKLPGTTFAKYWKRKDYDPLKAAAISLEELHRIVHVWLIDVYMCAMHRGLGCPPNQAWKKDSQTSVGYLPYAAQEIEIICNKTESHPIWHYGLELNSRQKYQSDALGALRSRLGVLDNGRSKSHVRVKSEQKDIGFVWVFDAFEKIWFKVPNVRPDYADKLSLHQHKMIKKFVAFEHRNSADYDVLLEGKEWIRQHTAKLQVSDKLSDRKRAAKIAGKSVSAAESQFKNQIDKKEWAENSDTKISDSPSALPPLAKTKRKTKSSQESSINQLDDSDQEGEYEIVPKTKLPQHPTKGSIQ